jgi:hypothetical protein
MRQRAMMETRGCQSTSAIQSSHSVSDQKNRTDTFLLPLCRVRLDATNIRALDVVGFKDLKRFAAEQEASNSSTRPIDPKSGNSGPIKESSQIGGTTERDAKA